MSGGIQGIDTNVTKKIHAISRKEQIMLTICIGLAIGGTYFILQNVFFNDPIVIERTIEVHEIRLSGPETPSTSVEILKTDDEDAVNIVDYAAFDEKVEIKKVGEKIIQSP